MITKSFWSASVVMVAASLTQAAPTQWPESTFNPLGWDSPTTMDQSPGVWDGTRNKFAINDPLRDPVVQYCFDAGSTPSAEVMEQINSLHQIGYGSRYNIGASWAGGAGTPVTLTWSFVPDGLLIDDGGLGGAQNSVLFSRMDSLFASLGGRARWIGLFQNSFDRWQQVSGINYQRVTDPGVDWDDGSSWGTSGNDVTRGDIRISMKNNLDGLSNVLAYNQFPSDGDMVLDGADGGNWVSSSNNFRFLRDVVMHEHGHGLGFAHVCPSNGTKLMEPFINTGFDGPQQDDIRAVHDNYGDINEPNNVFTSVVDVGAISSGGSLTIGNVPNQPSPTPAAIPANSATVSIDRLGEDDWYKFQITQPRLVNFTLTPIGSNYADYDQNANGSCQTGGANMNSLAAADLRFYIYQANGTSLIRDQNLTAAGTAETMTGLLSGPAGDIVVRVAGGAVSSTQLYKLAITVQSTNISPSATQGTSTAFTRITWPVIPNAGTYQLRRNTVDVQPTSAGSVIANGLSAATTSFDDTTGTPGVTYYYWLLANSFVSGTSGSTASFRYTTTGGVTGFRALPPNTSPTANAGPDQVVTDTDLGGSESITLDGSLSTDPDGTITNYLWKEGATILASVSTPTTVVSLPTGTHTIVLTVTDNGSATANDTVVIKVNNPPTANAGSNQSVSDADLNGSESVTLNGSGSSDTDGGITNYLWKEGPTTLASGATPTANVVFSVGVHNLVLTVTDTNGATSTSPVTITVTQPNNTLPNADAGQDQTVVDSDSSGSENVTLDGSLSNDPDGTITNYSWAEGVTVLASGASAVSPSVSLPVGVHNITLTVTDNRGATATDDVVITVNEATGCPCVADFDNSGGTPDAGDIDSFFFAWLSGDASADADCSGGTPDAGDIDQFFLEWLNGGC